MLGMTLWMGLNTEAGHTVQTALDSTVSVGHIDRMTSCCSKMVPELHRSVLNGVLNRAHAC